MQYLEKMILSEAVLYTESQLLLWF